MLKKDLISIKDLTTGEIEELFELTDEIKKDKARFTKVLAGKTLALIFQKPSNRTRVSFAVGMFELGGYSIYLGPDEINLGVRESIKDVAKTLSRYVDGIVLRTFEHKNVIDLAQFATVPVINGLSDLLHPCQALADVYTIREKLSPLISGIPKITPMADSANHAYGGFRQRRKGGNAGKNIEGITLAYIGDGNNVCNSLLHACSKVGINLNIATPKAYEPDKLVLKEAKVIAKAKNAAINLFAKPQGAVKDADVIYTDAWTSMGQEKEAKIRKRIFKEFQVNKNLVKLAKEDVLIMHCLPAHRGQEITDEIMESKNSVIFDQAENRMHVQKAILIKLLA